MNRRQFLTATASLCTLPLLSSCSNEPPVKVGLVNWPGYETLCLTKALHKLPPKVHLVQLESSQLTLSLLASGQLDVGCLTLDEMLRARNSGTPLTAITIFDFSAGADVVIANNDISSLKEIKNKRIGLEESAVGTLMLTKLLDSAGLSKNDVTVINCPLEQQTEQWSKQNVDVMISFYPMANHLLRSGGTIIFDSSALPNSIIDVLAVRTELLQSHADALRALVKAHFQGLNHIKFNREDAIYRIADHQNVSIREVKQSLSGIIQPSLEANREYLSGTDNRIINAAKELSLLLVNNQIISKPDSLIDLIDDSFLPEHVTNL